MAERSSHTGEDIKRILVTGPESAGKTELANYLGEYLNGRVIPEYARTYIERLDRSYTFEDVVRIAERQVLDFHRMTKGDKVVIFDTWLVISKVWFEVVFNRYPKWIDRELRDASFDVVLVCAPDIPWEPDPVRENGGEQREMLYRRYLDELDRLGWRHAIITGTGPERFENALENLKGVV